MTQDFVKDIKKLGFGLMRLPRNEDKTIDIEQTKVMVDHFLEAGLNYFDTAFVYEGSEEATKKALCERHPRESYYLASKLNAGAAKDEADAKNQINVTLERTGAQYIDFYLLHAISKDNIGFYDSYGLWDYVKELKEKGIVKHYGFSFHDTPEMLDELLTKHPDVEFVQLQINYADLDNPAIESRGIYEVARKHNKPIIVMEPIKGGMLANPPGGIGDMLKEANPDMSAASWAIRFVASLEGVMVVLSGMSNLEQMDDNLSYMADFKPLDKAENEVITKVQARLKEIPQIPCTKCNYCTPGCPMKIDIPEIFTSMNRHLIYEDTEGGQRNFDRAIKDHGKASECIKCMQCEGVCPQHIEITNWLEKAAEVFE